MVASICPCRGMPAAAGAAQRTDTLTAGGVQEDAEGEVPEGMSETSAASTSTSGLELVMERMKV